MNSKDIRRENLRALAKSIGGITALAKLLDKSQSQISHLIGTNPIKNIGDRLANQIEKVFNKPHGWLDHEHPELVKLLGIDSSLQKRGFNIEWVPLIHWQQISYWLSHPENIASLVHEYLPVNFHITPKTFALKLHNDGIFGDFTAHNQKDIHIIVEPKQDAEPGEVVLAAIGNDEEIAIRHYTKDGNKNVLKPLKSGQAVLELNEKNKLVGKIKQFILKMEN